MSWISPTPCRFHIQDNDRYCGPATAMMLLSQVGVSYQQLNQSALWTIIQNHKVLDETWGSDPAGLLGALNQLRPSEVPFLFNLYQRPSEIEATRDIIQAHWSHSLSSAALIQGDHHWLAVAAVETDVEPTTPGYSVKFLWLHNPRWKTFDVDVPFMHNFNDTCETLGFRWKMVTHEDWAASHFVGTVDPGLGGQRVFITIADSDERKIPLPAPPPAPPPIAAPIGAERAQEIVRELLELKELARRPEVAADLEGAVADSALFVGDVDERYRPYYLVPLAARGDVIATVNLDAADGRLRSVGFHNRRLKWLLKKKGLQAEMKGAMEEGRLAWRFCQESPDPHLPFLRTGEKSFMRIDQARFSSINPVGKGW